MLETKDFNFFTLLSKAWNIPREKLITLIGYFVGYFALSLFSDYVFDKEDTSFILLLLAILSTIVQFWYVLGLTKMSIKIVRKQKISFDDFYFDIVFVIRYLALTLLVFIITFFLTLLFVVPGIIALLALCLATWVFIDTEIDILEAINKSKKITDGYKWNLLGFFVLMVIFNILGVLCFGVGVLITAPLSMLMMANIYCNLSKDFDSKNKTVVSVAVLPKKKTIAKKTAIKKVVKKAVTKKPVTKKVVKKATTKTVSAKPKKVVKKVVKKKSSTKK